MAIRDGLGGEEITTSGTTIQDLVQPYFTGSITTESQISGANLYITDVISGAAIAGESLQNASGVLTSTLVGSATTNTWGAFVQTGSFDTGVGSTGFLKLGTPFATAAWSATVTSTGSIAGYEESYTSGVKNASGVNFVGAASLRYDFIAAGL